MRQAIPSSDVKTAKIVLATYVESLEGRSHHAAVAGNKGSLKVDINSIAVFLHREGTLVLHDRSDRANRSSQPRQLQTQEEAPTTTRLVGGIESVVRVTGKYFAGDDSFE